MLLGMLPCTSFIVRIASGHALVCGFGNGFWPRPCVCVFPESISDAGMGESFGTMQRSGKRRQKRERAGHLNAVRLWAVGVCFHLLA